MQGYAATETSSVVAMALYDTVVIQMHKEQVERASRIVAKHSL